MKFTVCKFLIVTIFVCLSMLNAMQLSARTMPELLLKPVVQIDPTAEPSISLNNLTDVTIEEEDEPFFTLIWKDSPGGKDAAVDVYFYDRSGKRTLAAMDKWACST